MHAPATRVRFLITMGRSAAHEIAAPRMDTQPHDHAIFCIPRFRCVDILTDLLLFCVVLKGWDWAPYSRMRDADGNPMFTKGVWKSVSAVAVPSASAVITHVTPLVYYTGEGWPTTPLSNGNATFDVVVKVVLLAPTAGVSGLVEVSGEWSGGGIQQVACSAIQLKFASL